MKTGHFIKEKQIKRKKKEVVDIGYRILRRSNGLASIK
jgi:hypothetical protein